MMKIFPKISEGQIPDRMKEIISTKEGIEIQFFDEAGPTESFNFEEQVTRRKEEFPNLKEIIIHPPLNNYNLEFLLLKDESMVEDIFTRLANLSKKLDIHISYVAHTYLNTVLFKSLNVDKKLGKYLKILEGSNVTILLENMFMVLDERRECAVINIAKMMDHPNLKVCIDTTHAHIKSTIWKIPFEEMIKSDATPEDCNKYVRQIHFASQLENDGYIDKITHGRVHSSIEDVEKEISWLRNLNMFDDKNIITEVSEDDYSTRVDQIKEIEMLEEAYKKEEL